MKSIKVTEGAQNQLKIYAAKVNANMSIVASEAILKYINSKSKKLKQ